MNKYVLPPQFDFLNNPNVDPIVMYIFEFEFKLDKDDLSRIFILRKILTPMGTTEAMEFLLEKM